MIFATTCTHTAIGDLVDITDYLIHLGKTEIHTLGLTLGLYHNHLKSMRDSETFKEDMIHAWLQKEDQVLLTLLYRNVGH